MNYDDKILILKHNNLKFKLEKDIKINKNIEKKIDSNKIYAINVIKINYLNWKQNRQIILTNNYLYNTNGKDIKLKYPLKLINLIIENINEQELIIRFHKRYDYHLNFINSEKKDFIYNLLLLCLLNKNKVKYYKKSLPNIRSLIYQKKFNENNLNLISNDNYLVK